MTLELIGYGELPMAGVAEQLGYSSPAHPSRQFRQVTGLTPTEFQKLDHLTLLPAGA